MRLLRFARNDKAIVLLAGLLLLWQTPLEAKTIAQARDQIVAATLKYLNIPYLWGGEHPQTGLDCSAFVRAVYREAGLPLPRVSLEQFSQTGRLNPEQVLPGDIIFFAMKRKRVDHVGIYVGKGYFVHASVTHGVHIDPITKPYYLERLVGVRKHKGF